MRSYCKDTQSLPARSLLNPEVRCLLLKLGLSRLTLKAANRRVLRRFQEVEVGGRGGVYGGLGGDALAGSAAVWCVAIAMPCTNALLAWFPLWNR